MWRVLNWFRAHREGAQVCRFELKPLVVREDSSTVRNRSIEEKAQSPSTYAPAHNASLTAAISRASSSVAVRRATSSPISAPGSKASRDALNGLPSSHGDVPKLGPPLPGDLGRPIVGRQCQLATRFRPLTRPPKPRLPNASACWLNEKQRECRVCSPRDLRHRTWPRPCPRPMRQATPRAFDRRSRSGRDRRCGWWCTRISSLPGVMEGAEVAELRLGKLPDRTPIKLAIAVPPDLKAAFDDYAVVYRSTYGQEESISDLIPAMLVQFLAGDRGFVRAREALRTGRDDR